MPGTSAHRLRGLQHRPGAAARDPRIRGRRTYYERLLPDLLPNSVARAGIGRDEERFGTAKSQTIRHVSRLPGMCRDRITKPLHCHCANPAFSLRPRFASSIALYRIGEPDVEAAGGTSTSS